MEVNTLEPYQAAQTFATPEIILDASQGLFSIKGSSYPEDPLPVYMPVIEWFQRYSQQPLPTTKMILSFTYFSTASTQLIFELFRILEEIASKGFDVKVCWHYSSENEEIFENGEDFSGLFDIPFELIEDK